MERDQILSKVDHTLLSQMCIRDRYKVAYGTAYETEQGCTIELEDDTVIRLSAGKWKQIVQKGLSICGYTQGQAIRKIRMKD